MSAARRFSKASSPTSRRSSGAVSVVVALWAGIAGCRRVASQESAPAIDEPSTQGDAQDAAPTGNAPRELSARCPKGGRPIALGDAGSQGEIEIGDTLEYDRGLAVGFAIREGAKRTAGVALLEPEATGAAKIIELGPVVDDAPAPLLARRSGDLLAAVFGVPPGRAHGGGDRELTIYAVGSDHADSLTSFDKPTDDSMAIGVASDGPDAFVVWDEASRARGGVVRGAPVTSRAVKAVVRDISPPESDAEDPRIVVDGAGYSVIWIARSPEAPTWVDAAEVTGVARSFGWLQRVEIDPLGAVRGPASDLTPRSGHVSAYDARMFAATGELVVVARDDGEAIDGSGGALLRVRARGAAIEPVQSVAVDGVGHGAPAFVDGKPPWLSWMGHDEQLRLLPLDAAGLPSGLPSSEGALSEARPLAVMASPSEATGHWLVATPTDPAGPLRLVECAPPRGLQ